MLGHNYVKIGHLIQKNIFWEMSVPQFLSIVPYAAKLEKKIIREDHEIQCCIILFNNCAKNCSFDKKKLRRGRGWGFDLSDCDLLIVCPFSCYKY